MCFILHFLIMSFSPTSILYVCMSVCMSVSQFLFDVFLFSFCFWFVVFSVLTRSKSRWNKKSMIPLFLLMRFYFKEPLLSNLLLYFCYLQTIVSSCLAFKTNVANPVAAHKIMEQWQDTMGLWDYAHV